LDYLRIFMGDADISTVIASLGSEKKTQWHRRPCRCPPQSGGVFSTGRDAGATFPFHPVRVGRQPMPNAQ
jgi:hypothetical protein